MRSVGSPHAWFIKLAGFLSADPVQLLYGRREVLLSIWDYLILAGVAIWLAVAVRYIVKQKKRGGCAGCSGCTGCRNPCNCAKEADEKEADNSKQKEKEDTEG